jgi:predicted membrane protein
MYKIIENQKYSVDSFFVGIVLIICVYYIFTKYYFKKKKKRKSFDDSLKELSWLSSKRQQFKAGHSLR